MTIAIIIVGLMSFMGLLFGFAAMVGCSKALQEIKDTRGQMFGFHGDLLKILNDNEARLTELEKRAKIRIH